MKDNKLKNDIMMGTFVMIALGAIAIVVAIVWGSIIFSSLSGEIATIISSSDIDGVTQNRILNAIGSAGTSITTLAIVSGVILGISMIIGLTMSSSAVKNVKSAFVSLGEYAKNIVTNGKQTRMDMPYIEATDLTKEINELNSYYTQIISEASLPIKKLEEKGYSREKISSAKGDLSNVVSAYNRSVDNINLKITDALSGITKLLKECGKDGNNIDNKWVMINSQINEISGVVKGYNNQAKELIDLIKRLDSGSYKLQSSSADFEAKKLLVVATGKIATFIDEANKVTSSLGGNNYSSKITGEYLGELGQLKQNLNRTFESLTREIIDTKESLKKEQQKQQELSKKISDMSPFRKAPAQVPVATPRATATAATTTAPKKDYNIHSKRSGAPETAPKDFIDFTGRSFGKY